ncbi:hypothetical protein BC792_13512 [Sphingobacterium allocomposti]|uniref:Uncharacterized protein n=1 Tax=Sphingobacterium allocomposti TaxID=415956 RepID=A0A5S5CXK2_9SPHI|nr:hypothetical protein BC792_13512 [Sphingobacterium composti Yoo et al. 2007 non Ten et al. 2007]
MTFKNQCVETSAVFLYHYMRLFCQEGVKLKSVLRQTKQMRHNTDL